MLNSSYYIKSKIFNIEKNKIFYKNWIFLALTNEFKNEDSAIVKSIFNQEIIITKKNNFFKAFLNICPHRFNKILEKDKSFSSKKFRCSYHGWCFNLDGNLEKIPFNKKLYGLDEKKINLFSINIKVIGNFIFVNFLNNQKKFNGQFSKKLIKEIEDISKKISDFSFFSTERKFNWKLIMENLRDPLHPLFLHPKTLLKTVKFSTPGIPKWLPVFLLPMRFASFGGPDSSITSPDYQKYFVSKWNAGNKYHNYHLFPNLHIACPDNGCTFIIENYIPIDENNTKINIFFLFTKHSMKNDQFELFKKKLLNDALIVYEEDFLMLENIQKNLNRNLDLFPTNGKYERLILRFHGIYIRLMGVFAYLYYYIRKLI